MRIAVASGKGGTGKTTVAVGLASVLSERHAVTLLDCDVEEPNAHLFLSPTFDQRRSVSKLLPVVDEERCTHCGVCAEACQFNALAVLPNRVLRYDALCHGCGRCAYVCPQDAITEASHELGIVETGTAHGFPFGHGRLNVGEAMATPVVHAVKAALPDTEVTILDAPPGTGCAAIATLRGAELAVLVTEPTPFGLHDLQAATRVAEALGLPVRVVLNRDGIGDDAVERYCREHQLPIVMRIPFDRQIAALYADGIPPVEALPELRLRFREFGNSLLEVGTR
jgi:MinD superfamily P-loop ATPase